MRLELGLRRGLDRGPNPTATPLEEALRTGTERGMPIVFVGESTGARARAIAVDQYLLGRPRSLRELAGRVESITLNKLRRFVADHPPGDMTIVTIGPSALDPGKHAG